MPVSKFDYGDRICIPDKDINWLGVVTDPSSNKALLDSGKPKVYDPIVSFKVNYWKEVPKPFRNKAAMEKYTTYVSNLSQFKARKATTLTVPLMRSMWYWLNFHVFDHKLKPITLKTIDSKSPLGLYRFDSAEGNRILVSTYNPTMVDIFSTVAHEMVHQLNYEYDVPENVYTRQEVNKHGTGFLKEAKKVSDKIGVHIDVQADGEGTKVDGLSQDQTGGSDYSNSPRGRKYAFLLMIYENKIIYGFYINRSSMIPDAKQLLQNHVRRVSGFNPRIYGGVSDFEIPKKYLTKYVTTEDKYSWRSMPKDVFNILKSDFKPLDIIEGPDQMKV